MTTALRLSAPCIATLLLSVAGAVQAQPRGTPAFAPLTSTQVESQRTAELLAATQYRNVVPVYTSNPAMTRLNERFEVTRQLDASPVVSTRPAPGARSQPVASAPISYIGAPQAAVGSSNVIPAMPDARAGECFALVQVPERFATYQREYEARAASERIETTPPRYENVTEQYVVQEAYERVEVIPAQFRMVTEQVEVAAPSSQYVASEPVYETITERVLETPARSVWKLGRGPVERIDHATGDIMCLVEEPAVYRNVTRRVLKAPAEAREVAVPGQYQLVNRRVLERPAEVRRVVVPQQIGTRTVRRMVQPGGVQRIAVPAQLATTTVRELVQPASLEWRSVLCETNMTPENIRRVQAALLREGFNPGPLDGRLSRSTLAALNQYQRARNLPEDQYLNLQTMRALGVG